MRHQIESTPELHPARGLRHSPIDGVVLTGGDVDAIAGLLTLRERHAFTIYAPRPVISVLDANPVFDVVARDLVPRVAFEPGETVMLRRADSAPSGLSAEVFAVPGKVPLYLERSGEMPAIDETGNTIGLCVSDGRSRLIFIPGCAAMSPALAERLRGAELVLFDGTLWSDDEMIRAGTGTKTGLRMGHMSVSGPRGTMAAFDGLGVRRKILIHINNSNPVLLDDSPERAHAASRGWEVAFDGMRIEL